MASRLAIAGGIALLAWWWHQRQQQAEEAEQIVACPGDWELAEQEGQLVWRCAQPGQPGVVLVRYEPPTNEAQAVARLALRHWPLPVAIIMTAIAGAESHWNPQAAGDCWGGYWSCRRCQSWGLWQIRMPVWHRVLRELGAPASPCDMARWLTNPENNARAADAVLQQHGLNAWSSYVSERWQRHAVAAVNAVLHELKLGQVMV